MFCKWSQIKMEWLFLQLIKKKLTSLDKFPHWTTTKYWIPPFLLPPPPIKVQKKFPLTNMSCLKWWVGDYVNTPKSAIVVDFLLPQCKIWLILFTQITIRGNSCIKLLTSKKKKKKSEKLPPSSISKHESARTLKHLVFLYSI